MLKFLKKSVPWLICLLVFGYLFYQIPPHELWAAISMTSIPHFIFLALLYFFIIHIIDCITITIFLNRFATPLSFKECWVVRGVSYLMMVLNYHAGQGAFAVYFKKTHGAPFSKSLGTLAFISIMDLLLVFTSALLAIQFKDIHYPAFDIKSFMLACMPVLYLGFILWVLFWKNVEHPIVNRFKKFRAVKWLLEHDLFYVFRETTLKDFLILLACRTPMIIVVIGGLNFAMFAFDTAIDWVSLYLFNPIIMFASTLPITPAGLGTNQFLTIEFFKTELAPNADLMNGSVTPSSLLLAASLLWLIANQVIKAIFGAICLSRTSKDLFVETN